MAACSGLILLTPVSGAATTIVPDTNIGLALGGFSADYSLLIFQDVARIDATAIHFDFDGTTINVAFSLLDEGSDWYVVADRDLFSQTNIDAGQFQELVVLAAPNGPVTIGTGDFFLGVVTGLGFTGQDPNRNAFGWIELSSIGSSLTALGSAVAYDANGIVVGTTTATPEPSTALLLTAGLTALTYRKKAPLSCCRIHCTSNKRRFESTICTGIPS